MLTGQYSPDNLANEMQLVLFTVRNNVKLQSLKVNYCPVPDMTYNVFGRTLNLTQSTVVYCKNNMQVILPKTELLSVVNVHSA